MRELYPDLVNGAEGVPQIDSQECPFKTFDNLPFSTWPEAKLVQVLRYLRGNKHLRVPKDWLAVFPQPFEILHKLEMDRLEDRET